MTQNAERPDWAYLDTPADTPTLHVITHRAWVARDLADGAARLAASGGARVDVEHHLGFDLPRFAPGDTIWAPMEWMARAVAQDPRLRLADPGPEFLPSLPWEFRRRTVELLTVDDMDTRIPDSILDDGDLVFAKPANCKIEHFPARWDDYDGHALQATAAGIPDDQTFLVTDIRLDLAVEFRLFVLDGRVVTSSPYLMHAPDGTQRTWDETMHSSYSAAAVEFGAQVLDWLTTPENTTAVPRSFTLDVGIETDGTWVVIEANPVWSSAFYGANTSAVIACLLAGVTVTRASGRYSPPTRGEWTPDPYLSHRVTQQRPLPVAPAISRPARSTP